MTLTCAACKFMEVEAFAHKTFYYCATCKRYTCFYDFRELEDILELASGTEDQK